MYLKCSTRHKNGKEHRSWYIAESRPLQVSERKSSDRREGSCRICKSIANLKKWGRVGDENKTRRNKRSLPNKPRPVGGGENVPLARCHDRPRRKNERHRKHLRRERFFRSVLGAVRRGNESKNHPPMGNRRECLCGMGGLHSPKICSVETKIKNFEVDTLDRQQARSIRNGTDSDHEPPSGKI